MPTKRTKTIEENEPTLSTTDTEMVSVPYAPRGALVATSDFEYSPYPGAPTSTVHAGDTFTPPDGWVRDVTYEEILIAAKSKHGKAYEPGAVFNYQGVVINPSEKNPALRERREHRAILPLKES